jgi:endonuclease YncB( thermonuclease family)
MARRRPGRSARVKLPGTGRSVALHLIYRRFGLAGAVVAIVLILLAALFQQSKSLPVHGDWDTYHQKTFKVVHVIDGDTIRVDQPDGDKKSTTIRFWGIDTPELQHRDTDPPDQPFAREARDLARQLVDQRMVTLQLERHSLRDRHGRLLAYIYLPDGRCLNEIMIEHGYARADQRYGHSQLNRYVELESTARRKRLGIWGQSTRSSSASKKSQERQTVEAGAK